jgi:hypothetical protein
MRIAASPELGQQSTVEDELAARARALAIRQSPGWAGASGRFHRDRGRFPHPTRAAERAKRANQLLRARRTGGGRRAQLSTDAPRTERGPLDVARRLSDADVRIWFG